MKSRKKLKITRKIRKNEVINVYLPSCDREIVSNEDERYGSAIEHLMDGNQYNF